MFGEGIDEKISKIVDKLFPEFYYKGMTEDSILLGKKTSLSLLPKVFKINIEDFMLYDIPRKISTLRWNNNDLAEDYVKEIISMSKNSRDYGYRIVIKNTLDFIENLMDSTKELRTVNNTNEIEFNFTETSSISNIKYQYNYVKNVVIITFLTLFVQWQCLFRTLNINNMLESKVLKLSGILSIFYG